MDLIPVKFEGLPDTRPEKGSTTRRLRSSDIPKEVPTKMSFSSLYGKSTNDSELKLQALNMAIELVETATDIWKSVLAFPELFQPTNSILSLISKTKLYRSFPSPTLVLIFQTYELILDPHNGSSRDPITPDKTFCWISGSPNLATSSTYPNSVISSQIQNGIFSGFEE
jgi:hypothetical protein